MKYIQIILIIFTFSAYSQQERINLSMEEAINYAQLNNLTLKSELHKIKILLLKRCFKSRPFNPRKS